MFFSFFWEVDTYPICTMYNDLALSLSPDEHSNLGIPVILYIALKLRHGNRATNRINHVTILLDSGLAREGCFVN